MAVRVSAVTLLRNVICAFCTTALGGSVTVPVNALVDAECASRSNELMTTSRQTTRARAPESVAAEHSCCRGRRPGCSDLWIDPRTDGRCGVGLAGARPRHHTNSLS